MKTYSVSLRELPGDEFLILFHCYAEDEDHADEQAENAYPGCQLQITVEIPESDYMRV